MKTSELIGPTLDWAVEFIKGGCRAEPRANYWLEKWVDPERRYLCESASTDWAQGGPIIDREHICSFFYSSDEDGNPCEPAWEAFINFDGQHYTGNTQLIAAMRCYVASKLGDEIEIPEDLK